MNATRFADAIVRPAIGSVNYDGIHTGVITGGTIPSGAELFEACNVSKNLYRKAW